MKILTDTGLMVLWNKIKQLVLGNRPYNPSEFSGNGYKVLEKNIQTVGGVKKNILTEVMLNQSNCIYEIRYDFDLDGKTLEVPENCTLKFEGGSLSNGTISSDNLYIDANEDSIIFNELLIDGKICNDIVYAYWYGLVPDIKKDCTPILKTYIQHLNVPIQFNKGTYYFSEYYINNTNQDCLSLLGFKDFGLSYKTIFKAFDENTQRYIIKVGGGDNNFGNTGRGYNISIERIHFSGNLGKGIKENPLINKYLADGIDYKGSLLILDAVEIGKFSISGDTRETPFLTLGYIYECCFDNIICYKAEGKSNLPTIQINTDWERYISATKIHNLMFENNAGILFLVSFGSGIIELIIDNLFFEQTIQWCFYTVPNNAYSYDVKRDTCNNSNINVVPMFDLNGTGAILVNNIIVGEANQLWWNKFDHPNQTWDNSTLDTTRGFVKFASSYSSTNKLIVGNIENSSQTPYFFIDGGNNKQNTCLKVNYLVNTVDIVPKKESNVNIDCSYSHIDVRPTLVTNKKYSNNSLLKLASSKFIENLGYTNRPTFINKQLVINTSGYSDTTKSYSINENGFNIERDAKYIVVFAYVGYEGYSEMQIELYDAKDNLILSDGESSVSVQDIVAYNFTGVRQFIMKITQKNVCYFKIKHSPKYNYFRVASIEATNYSPVVTINNTRGMVDGCIYEDLNSKETFYFKGNKWVNNKGDEAGTLYVGNYSQKPSSPNIGFKYFNTDTHKTITWDGSKWWNPDGTEATS